VLLPEGGGSVVVVEVGVPFLADAEQAEVDQPDYAGHDPVAGQAAVPQVPRGGRSQPGQRAGEPEHVPELLGVALLPPELVVEVLEPALAVGARGLDVAERVRRDPDVGPGGRDPECPDPLQRRGVGDLRPGQVEVPEAVPGPDPGDAGTVRVAAHQAGDGGGQRRCFLAHENTA
jgi:hypothetical protein